MEKDYLVCLIPSAHPFSTRKSVFIHELENQSIIACNPLNAPISTAAFQQKLLNELTFESMHYCNTIEIAHCMVAASMGIAVLPYLLCPDSDKFCTVPIENTKELTFGIFYHKGNKLKALRDFLQMLED